MQEEQEEAQGFIVGSLINRHSRYFRPLGVLIHHAVLNPLTWCKRKIGTSFFRFIDIYLFICTAFNSVRRSQAPAPFQLNTPLTVVEEKKKRASGFSDLRGMRQWGNWYRFFDAASLAQLRLGNRTLNLWSSGLTKHAS